MICFVSRRRQLVADDNFEWRGGLVDYFYLFIPISFILSIVVALLERSIFPSFVLPSAFLTYFLNPRPYRLSSWCDLSFFLSFYLCVSFFARHALLYCFCLPLFFSSLIDGSVLPFFLSFFLPFFLLVLSASFVRFVITTHFFIDRSSILEQSIIVDRLWSGNQRGNGSKKEIRNQTQSNLEKREG